MQRQAPTPVNRVSPPKVAGRLSLAQGNTEHEIHPTLDIYQKLLASYNFFNQELFAGKLPDCVLTFQREKNVMGYYSPGRWANGAKDIVDEIAINPAYLANRPLVELFQTLVHEQCHAWQKHFGTPSRACYHNSEWADKMESVGLIPSHTGGPEGRRTGQKMGDYPEEGGIFITKCQALLQGPNIFNWVDLRAEGKPLTGPGTLSADCPIDVQALLQTPIIQLLPPMQQKLVHDRQTVSKQKIKYTCTCCKINVWGKSNLKIECMDCQIPMNESN